MKRHNCFFWKSGDFLLYPAGCSQTICVGYINYMSYLRKKGSFCSICWLYNKVVDAMVLLFVTMQKYALKSFECVGDMFEKLKDVCINEACGMAYRLLCIWSSCKTLKWNKMI